MVRAVLAGAIACAVACGGVQQRFPDDVAGKRHLLREALAEIRADNIPDELQIAELDELEAKVRELS